WDCPLPLSTLPSTLLSSLPRPTESDSRVKTRNRSAPKSVRPLLSCDCRRPRPCLGPVRRMLCRYWQLRFPTRQFLQGWPRSHLTLRSRQQSQTCRGFSRSAPTMASGVKKLEREEEVRGSRCGVCYSVASGIGDNRGRGCCAGNVRDLV